MKRYIYILLGYLLLGTVVSSCNRKSTFDEESFFINAIDHAQISNSYKWIVIIPGAGCSGCIQEGEFFMKNYVNNGNILFVLTNLSSLKILQSKTGVKIKEHSNIYVDRGNDFYLPTINSVYPCVIRMEKGKVTKFSFQTPQTTALYDLEEILENSK